MNKVRLIMVVSFLITTVAINAETEIPQTGAQYGISISYINAGTGHGNGYTLSGIVSQKRKSLEVGLVYSEKERGIAGADIKFRIYAFKFQYLYHSGFSIKPYLQYNILFQKSMSYAPQIMELGGKKYELPVKSGKIATFGHFIAYGSQFWLFKQIYFDTSFGIGIYQGSLDKINGPGTPGKHWENSGITYSFKIGFGYFF
jgi:hypothetical protein